MSAPTVSVITPTWERRAFVGDAIESVLAQTFEDLELVIADDGSTDGTADMIEARYGSDPRVVLLRLEHQGVSAARNAALEQSRGRYVAFLDSDDVMRPTCLTSQVACLEANPDAAMVHCDSLLVGAEHGHTQLSALPWFDVPTSLADMFAGGWGSPDC